MFLVGYFTQRICRALFKLEVDKKVVRENLF